MNSFLLLLIDIVLVAFILIQFNFGISSVKPSCRSSGIKSTSRFAVEVSAFTLLQFQLMWSQSRENTYENWFLGASSGLCYCFAERYNEPKHEGSFVTSLRQTVKLRIMSRITRE